MISAVYQNEKILLQIKKEFVKNKILKLESFFTKSYYDSLREETESLKFKHKKVANQFSYSVCEEKNKIEKLIYLQYLENFTKAITAKTIKSLEIKKFTHKDYTLLHDSTIKTSQTKMFIFICERWDPDLGGNFVFTKTDGKTFYITPMENSIFLVEKQKDWREFVQYINHLSNNREIIVIECVLN